MPAIKKRYTLVVGSDEIKNYSWILLLQCRYSDYFKLQVSEKYIQKANELIKLFKYLGLEEDDDRIKKTIQTKNGYDLDVFEISVRKIGAIRV